MDKKQPLHTLPDVLAKLMAEKRIDDATLSASTGVTPSTLARLKSDQSCNPTVVNLKPIAQFFNISITQLLGDEPLPSENNPKNFKTFQMPLIEWREIIEFSNKKEAIAADNILRWVCTERNVSEKSFATVVPSDSFESPFLKGAVIIIDPEYPLKDGDYAFFKMNAQALAFKKVLIDGQDIYLKSVNTGLDKTVIAGNQWECVGVAVEVRNDL